MFQRPLGHIFLLPAFSSHLLCTTPQEAGWVFCDLCVCVCEFVLWGEEGQAIETA